MYAYFGGVATSILRPILPYTGYLQLIAGILVDVFYFVAIQLFGKDPIESDSRTVGLLLLLQYALLFREELRTGSQQKSLKKNPGEQEVKTKADDENQAM